MGFLFECVTTIIYKVINLTLHSSFSLLCRDSIYLRVYYSDHCCKCNICVFVIVSELYFACHKAHYHIFVVLLNAIFNLEHKRYLLFPIVSSFYLNAQGDKDFYNSLCYCHLKNKFEKLSIIEFRS